MNIFKRFKKNKITTTVINMKNNDRIMVNSDFDKIASNALKDWNFEDTTSKFQSLDIKKLLQKIDELNLINLDLRNEVSYYEKYLEFLEQNFIFISKNTKNIQEIFDKIGEANE